MSRKPLLTAYQILKHCNIMYCLCMMYLICDTMINNYLLIYLLTYLVNGVGFGNVSPYVCTDCFSSI